MNSSEQPKRSQEQEAGKESEPQKEKRDIAPDEFVDWIGRQASVFTDETTTQLEGAGASIGLDPVAVLRMRENQYP